MRFLWAILLMLVTIPLAVGCWTNALAFAPPVSGA